MPQKHFMVALKLTKRKNFKPQSSLEKRIQKGTKKSRKSTQSSSVLQRSLKQQQMALQAKNQMTFTYNG